MTAGVLPVQWTLAGFGLSGYDDQGCRWITRKTRGWRGTAPPRTDRTARPTSSGSYEGQSYRNERVIVLDGTTKCPSAAARADAEERLAQLLPDGIGQVPLLRVGENSLPQQRYVSLDDVIDPIPVGKRWFDWSIQVVAADPRKFTPDWVSATSPTPIAGTGGIVSTGTGIVSTGLGIAAGTAPRALVASVIGIGAVPNQVVFELTGPTIGEVTIAQLGGPALVRYRGVLADGDSVYINADTHPAHDVPGAAAAIPGRGALLGGYSANSAVSVSGGWPVLAPGQVASFVLGGATSAGASLTVHTRGAWG